MLTKADNDMLTRVGPGTPMGELMRRFWVPALLRTELPEPDCAPIRLRLLGENLIAFRMTSGAVGVVGEACPHRGASLFFGRNEEDGLRCVYHGWKFDLTGACVDMPNEPAESNFKHKIRATAYPARESGGVVWAYMGPNDRMPELPRMEWCAVPEGYRHVAKWHQEMNYMQGMEGEIDTAHVSFLHKWLKPELSPRPKENRRGLAMADGAPELTVKDDEYGFAYGGRRAGEKGEYYWRVTQWLLPFYSLIASDSFPRGGRAYIPIDDENTCVFAYYYCVDGPVPEDDLKYFRAGARATARVIPGTFRPLANASNDYLIDRELQKAGSYSGIWADREQDMAMTESMGRIYDRTNERLGTTDLAIIAARRRLIQLAKQLQEGTEPYAAGHGDIYFIRSLDCVDVEGNLGPLLEKHRNQFMPVG